MEAGSGPCSTSTQSLARHRIHYTQSTCPRATGAELAQPWTATRCHRLLRPLLTHIAALRKDKELRASIWNSESQTKLIPSRRTVLGKRSYPYDDSEYSDKKTCRKYSRKASRRTSSADQSCTPPRNGQMQRRQPGNKASQDVVLPTPFLRRVRNHQPSSPAQGPDEACHEEATAASRCGHSGSGCKSKCAFEVELAGLRTSMDSERHGLYESVFKAFDYLLRASSPRKNHAAGPKSLLAMCLRKVPAYIVGLEASEKGDADSNGTKAAVQGAGLSFEIYSELESLGAVDGWRHLCLLVRAHAVHIIQEAASEGLLTDSVTELLIRLCLEYMPATEFMGLIETFAVRQYPKSHSAEDDLFTAAALRPLRILKLCDPSGSSIMPRMLADLLADELLPGDWILNPSFISLWPSTVRHVTQMKPCQDALDLIVTTLELLCELASPKKPRGVPQTRLRGKSQMTLISAVAALGSVVLLSEEGSSEDSETSSATRAAALHRRMDYIVTNCTSNLKRRKAGGRKLGTYLLALCSFLSLSDPPSSTFSLSSTLEASWRGVQHCRGNASLMLQYDATTALMSAMAYSCSRGTGLAPHVYLSQFCDRLEALDLPRGALSNMRVDGAFRLAEHTGDLRDLAFAEGLRERQQAHAAAAICTTPEKNIRGSGDRGKKKVASFSGIRWDDGISEWVAATPGTEVSPIGRRLGLRSREAVGHADVMEQDEGVSETEPETEPDDVNPGSPAAGDVSDDSASETDNETETTDTQSPNTEASPVPSDPDSDPASEGRPHPDDDDHHPHNDGDADPASPRSAKLDDSPPAPAGGFLAARPRRLSRRITYAGDELAFEADHHQNNNTKENTPERGNWLSRKKPARFRLGSTAAGGKRVARASLVYLQPLQPVQPVGRSRAVTTGKVWGGDGEGESGDELSIL